MEGEYKVVCASVSLRGNSGIGEIQHRGGWTVRRASFIYLFNRVYRVELCKLLTGVDGQTGGKFILLTVDQLLQRVSVTGAPRGLDHELCAGDYCASCFPHQSRKNTN